MELQGPLGLQSSMTDRALEITHVVVALQVSAQIIRGDERLRAELADEFLHEVHALHLLVGFTVLDHGGAAGIVLFRKTRQSLKQR